MFKSEDANQAFATLFLKFIFLRFMLTLAIFLVVSLNHCIGLDLLS